MKAQRVNMVIGSAEFCIDNDLRQIADVNSELKLELNVS